MVNITISDKVIKEQDFVVIPRLEYEHLLMSVSSFPKKSAKSKTRIGKNHFLYKALVDVKKGKVIGPFENVDSLMKHLNK